MALVDRPSASRVCDCLFELRDHALQRDLAVGAFEQLGHLRPVDLGRGEVEREPAGRAPVGRLVEARILEQRGTLRGFRLEDHRVSLFVEAREDGEDLLAGAKRGTAPRLDLACFGQSERERAEVRQERIVVAVDAWMYY